MNIYMYIEREREKDREGERERERERARERERDELYDYCILGMKYYTMMYHTLLIQCCTVLDKP